MYSSTYFSAGHFKLGESKERESFSLVILVQGVEPSAIRFRL